MIPIWWSTSSCTQNSILNPSKTITSEKYTQQINWIHAKLQQTLVFKIIPILLQNNAGLLVIQPTLQTLNALCCKVEILWIHHIHKKICYHFRETALCREASLQAAGTRGSMQRKLLWKRLSFYQDGFYDTRISKLTFPWQNVLFSMVSVLLIQISLSLEIMI